MTGRLLGKIGLITIKCKSCEEYPSKKQGLGDLILIKASKPLEKSEL